MRIVLGLILTACAARGAGEAYPDDRDPRSPDKPLAIVFEPWWCSQCVKEKNVEAGPKEITLMRIPADQFAKKVGLDRNWLVIESPHFRFFSSLKGDTVKLTDGEFARADLERLKKVFPRLSIGAQGASLTSHQRAHLFHIRIERVYAHFQALTANAEPYLGMKAPYEVYLFDDYAEHHVLCDEMLGRVQDKAGVQDHRKDLPNYMMFTTADSVVDGGEQSFANHVIHNIAHLLADGHGNYFRETLAWVEEGLAHYYERRESPRFNTFCWGEGKKPADFQKEDWESTLFNLVKRGKDAPLSQWCDKILPGELTAAEQGMCWSVVRWLIETEPLRFAKMVQKIDDYEGKPTGTQCIEFAFGVAPTVLHQRWREYVLKAYAKK